MAVFYEPEFEVIESVLMKSPLTGVIRELDIQITERANPKNKILVECRDHKRRQNVLWIDQLDGKARSLGISRVIAVSSSRFTKSATLEAEVKGIRAWHLKEAEECDWRTWKFPLEKFGVNIKFDLEVKHVDYGVPAEYENSLPDPIPKPVYFKNTKTGNRILVADYVKGMKEDQNLIAKLTPLSENDTINHYKIKIPCDPGLCIEFPSELEGVSSTIPIVQVTFDVDQTIAEYDIPLAHMEVAGERILTGEANILGSPTRLVVHEEPGHLKVMLEQSGPPSR